MPYSITTKDGITIQNIPDDVPSDSQSLRDRVATIRSGKTGAPQQAEAQPRTGLEEAGRQAGLTARYGIEGAAAGAGAITDPIIQAIGGVVRNVTGSDYDPATLASIGRGVANVLGLPSPETPQERIVGALARGVAGGASGAATAGQAINATRGTTQAVAQQLAANPALQAVSGGAAGTAGQAVQEAGGGAGAQLAAALAAGVAAPGAVGAAQRVVQAARGGVINPAQQAILDAGERANVPVMTSDVLPPKTFLGKQGQAVTERIPIVGTGAVRETQQAARQQAVSDLANQYGTPSYESIVSSLKGKVGAVKRAAGTVIDKTGQELDQAGTVTPTKSVQAIDDAIAELSNPNVRNPKSEQHIATLQDLKDKLANGQQSFSTLRMNRTAFKDELDSVDAAGRSQWPTYAKKLVGNVYGAMKSDLDEFAQANLPQAKFDKLLKANQVYGNEAQLLKASRLKNVLDKADVTPEVVRNLIYSNKPSENRILFDSLGTAGRQQVKAALIDDAATKALRGGEINPNAFGTELAKHNAKLDVFFRGQDRETLHGFTRLLQATRRAQDAAAAPTTTGVTLLPYGLGAAALADFGSTIAGAVTAGGFARLYESAPVRDLLLKLNNARPNSTAEERHIRSLVSALREESTRQQQKDKVKDKIKSVNQPVQQQAQNF